MSSSAWRPTPRCRRTPVPDPIGLLGALRASQKRLAALVGDLGESELERPSYDDAWNVADVLSHLGSQAEIFGLFVDAGLEGREPPKEAFGPIWGAWNAKAPAAQAADSLAADAAFLERFEAIDTERLARFELSFFGMEIDDAGMLGMGLGEHALHIWDV